MEDHVRAAVAYIAGRLISGFSAAGVYDHSRSRSITLNGMAKGRVVGIFDHDRQCHITGTGNDQQYSLFHHGERRPIYLTLDGKAFCAHDYGCTTRFTGMVEGVFISIYENALCKGFGYTLNVSLDSPWKGPANESASEPDQSGPGLPPA